MSVFLLPQFRQYFHIDLTPCPDVLKKSKSLSLLVFYFFFFFFFRRALLNFAARGRRTTSATASLPGYNRLKRIRGFPPFFFFFFETALTALYGSGMQVAAGSAVFPRGQNAMPRRMEGISVAIVAGSKENNVILTRTQMFAATWHALYT